jgi:hypothetical protein
MPLLISPAQGSESHSPKEAGAFRPWLPLVQISAYWRPTPLRGRRYSMNTKVTSLIFAAMFVLCQLVLAQSTQVVLQPGPEGRDVWITDTYSYNSDYGVDDDKLQVGGWGDRYYSLISFDLSKGPAKADSAVIYLYSFSTPNDGTYISMYLDRVTQPWDENTGWYNKPATVQQAAILPAPVPDQWYAIDITELYNNWKRGLYPNYGIQLRPTQWCCKDSANFRSSDYSVAAYRPKLVISNGSLAFPLSGKTPYNNVVTAIMDHSVPKGYYNSNADHKVLAYDGEVGNRNPYNFTNTIIGYQNSTNDSNSMPAPFLLPLLNYNDLKSTTGKSYLYYDGHSGYDYAAEWNQSILSSSSGTLCVSTSATAPGGGVPWRNTSKCPYGNDTAVNGSLSPGQTSWDRWHMFYIVDSGGYLSTWYLHADMLKSDIWNSIVTNGYATVTKLQAVGYVGNFGLGCSNHDCKHLHFEVRTSLPTVVDPYGNGVTGVLWELKPYGY